MPCGGNRSANENPKRIRPDMPFAFFTRLFTDPLKRALQNGALIIDVRTPREYDGGHIPEALNIPLERIVSGSDGLQQARRPLILCCSTGQRSR
ncbi:MAG: hypothetical protein RJA57_1516, partial [Bacteroidota bacterium]